MAKSDKAEVADEVNPLEAPGFHVVSGDTYCGNYATKADAEAFIEQHLAPQELSGKVVEVE